MAVRKYAGEEAVSRISEYVNKKLTVVSAVPTSPTELRSILYVGPTTEDYVQGCVYLYDEENDEWVLTDLASLHETSWTGTQNEWNALTSDEQARYEIVNFTDDFVPGTNDHVVSGYYYEGKFYEDAEHTSEIAGVVGFIYIDLPYDDLYLYDDTNSEFVLAGGGGMDSIVWGYYYEGDFYEDSAHTTLITPAEDYLYVDLSENSIYIYKTNAYVQISGGGGTTYAAGFGIKIDNDEISTTDFVGTQAQWNALTSAEKAAYDFVHITDDASPENYSPGHAISDGTSEKTQREVLEFEGFTVTDDSVNGKTKVAEIPYTAGDGVEITDKEISISDDISRTWTGTKAAWDAIADKSAYDGWIINITDDQTSGVGVVVDTVEEGNMNAITSNAVAKVADRGTIEVIADGAKTWGQLIASLHSEINESKLTKDSVVKYSTSAVTVFFRIVTIGVSWLGFSSVRNTSLPNANSLVCYMLFNTSGSAYTENTNGTAVDHTSDVVSAGSSLTLYY